MKEMIYDSAIKDVILLDNGIYKDFKYFIVNRGGNYPLAYIKVPDTLKISCEDLFEIDLDSPHGGITFGCEDAVPPLLKGIASKGNYLGWSYDHWDFGDDCDDYINYYVTESKKRWTTKEILEQVKNTIEEIRDAER